MAYGRRPRLGRLDLMVLGASPEKLKAQKEVSAIDTPALSDEQQQLLYRLNYKQRVGTLSPAEQMMRYRLESIARGQK